MIEILSEIVGDSGDASGIIVVSACLLGMRTRYDGESSSCAELLELAERCVKIPVCPEVMGGLSIPRPPAEIVGGDGRDVLEGRARVIRCDGVEVTEAYIKGAEAVVERALAEGAKAACLKDKSPACGARHIKRKGETVEGMGVCAAALAREGIRIISI